MLGTYSTIEEGTMQAELRLRVQIFDNSIQFKRVHIIMPEELLINHAGNKNVTGRTHSLVFMICTAWSVHPFTHFSSYRCVNTTDDGEGETVANKFCNQSEIPLDIQKCTLYCPNECVVSEWSRWSQCSQVN